MFRSPSRPRAARRLALGVLLLAAAARPGLGAARFEVSGRTSTPDAATLEVVVFLKNAGDAAASPLEVEGEIFEERSRMRLDRGVEPGETEHVVLSFPLAAARPGQSALILLIEWPTGGPDNAAVPKAASQRAYLTLNLGAAAGAGPAVKLEVKDVALETLGRIPVALESADGAAHRVLLRVHPPRGLNVFGPPVEADVPPKGRVEATLQLLRAGAPRGSQQGILVEAQDLGGSEERSAVVASVVTIAPDPALLPRLRPALWALAALLVAGSVYRAALARRR